MKKIIIVSILAIAMICSLTTVVRATDAIDIGGFTDIEENPQEQEPTTPPAEEQQTQNEQTPTPVIENNTEDNSIAKTQNPDTGIKEETPIILVTILGICVAVYAGRKIKKYNY